MKKSFNQIILALAAATLLTGCIGLTFGGGERKSVSPTVGQQLIDLKAAKDSGAISDSEFEAQKTKLLAK